MAFSRAGKIIFWGAFGTAIIAILLIVVPMVMGPLDSFDAVSEKDVIVESESLSLSPAEESALNEAFLAWFESAGGKAVNVSVNNFDEIGMGRGVLVKGPVGVVFF
jgi:hypothetical protein